MPRSLELYQGRLIVYSLGNFATYYGIGIAGDTGVAPLVEATLAPDGAFMEGRIHSFRRVRPDGVRLDKTQRALRLMRELTAVDFAGGAGVR